MLSNARYGCRLVWAQLDTAPGTGRWAPSPPSEGGEGRGEEGRRVPASPLSPALPMNRLIRTQRLGADKDSKAHLFPPLRKR